jgi:Helix-turn-helix.
MGIGYILDQLLKEKDINVNELARKTAISPSTLYSIIRRDNMKVDLEVLIKIARELKVAIDYFYDRSQSSNIYYLDPETAHLAQEIYDNPDLRILMDASRKLAPADIKNIADIVTKMKKKENHKDD